MNHSYLMTELDEESTTPGTPGLSIKWYLHFMRIIARLLSLENILKYSALKLKTTVKAKVSNIIRFF